MVAPKKARLEEMNTILNAANATLATKQVWLKEFRLQDSHYLGLEDPDKNDLGLVWYIESLGSNVVGISPVK